MWKVRVEMKYGIGTAMLITLSFFGSAVAPLNGSAGAVVADHPSSSVLSTITPNALGTGWLCVLFPSLPECRS